MKSVLNIIDQWLRRFSVYRFTLYVLLFLYGSALVLSVFGYLSYDPIDLVYAVILATAVCRITNAVFAKVFEAPVKFESSLITALILALIITPPKLTDGLSAALFLGWVCVLAMASKYILTVNRKNFLNPAAFAVALTAFAVSQSASWWVGTPVMMPLVIVVGVLLVRKAARFDLVASFFAVAITATVVAAGLEGADVRESLGHIILHSPLFFFAFIMLTEPMTLPLTSVQRKWYGALVGLLFIPSVHFGPLYFTPELALLAGNLFSFFIGPKGKRVASFFFARATA